MRMPIPHCGKKNNTHGKKMLWKNMVILDTNAILRFILRDNLSMEEEVRLLLSSRVCFIPVEVVAEIVYVLSKIYGVERNVIAKTITDLTKLDSITVAQKEVVIHAFDVYASTTFDFVDCLLIGYSKEQQYSVFTFDRKLQGYLNKMDKME